MAKKGIKIIKNGPYIVSGNVPLNEKIIMPVGKKYEYVEGKKLPQGEEYSLCRCGKSSNPPFCDGSHTDEIFDGTETASKRDFEDRAEMIEGPGIDLLDDGRCAYARFCHRDEGNVWELTKNSNSPELIQEAIIAASDCPAGRLVAVNKNGKRIEPEYEPELVILQDPQNKCSGGIFVKGKIPIESADGEMYEVRNRVDLCRCGKSRNKPFCDAMHVSARYKDKL